MTKLVTFLRSTFSVKRPPGSDAGKARDAICLGLYFFLFAMFFALPFGEESAPGFVIAVAIASFTYLYLDIRKTRREINVAANACTLAIFISLFTAWFLLGMTELPQLVA